MITKTFICDVCKKSVGETDLVKIDVSFAMTKAPNGYSSYTARTSKDVCKECLQKRGIITDVPDEKQRDEITKKAEKSVSDKIVEFLSDLGVAFNE